MISHRSIVRSLVAGTILALSILAAAAETTTMTASKTEYAPLNGLISTTKFVEPENPWTCCNSSMRGRLQRSNSRMRKLAD